MMTAAQILRAEAQVFTDFPDVHCKGRFAKNKAGKRVEVNDSDASKFCAHGFLHRAAYEGLVSNECKNLAADALLAASTSLYGGLSGIDVNDGPDGRRRIIKACLLAAKTLEAA